LPVIFEYIPFILRIVGVAYAIVVTVSFVPIVIIVQSLLRRPGLANVSKQDKMLSEVIWIFLPISLLAGAFLP
jgi:hypothetical protein